MLPMMPRRGVAVIGIEGLAVEMGGEEEVVGEGGHRGGGWWSIRIRRVGWQNWRWGLGVMMPWRTSSPTETPSQRVSNLDQRVTQMDIHFELGLGELVEFLPSPGFFLLYVAKDAEGPGVEIGFGDGAVVKNGEFDRGGLTGREAVFGFHLLFKFAAGCHRKFLSILI